MEGFRFGAGSERIIMNVGGLCIHEVKILQSMHNLFDCKQD